MEKILKIVLFLALIISFSSCKKKKVAKEKDVFVQQQAETNIVGLHEAYLLEVKKLQTNILTCTDNPTTSHLLEAQNSWKTTVEIYSKTLVYNIGEIKSGYAHTYLANWPVDTVKIKYQIDNEPTNADVPSRSRGLHAIEWMLFNKNALSSLQSNGQYKTFLIALIDDLISQSESLLSKWNQNIDKFKINDGENTSNSFNQLVNGVIQLIDDMKYAVGTPMGKYSLNVIDTLQSQSVNADYSHKILVSQLNIIYEIWEGNSISGNEIQSLKSIVEIQNESLAKTITEQIDLVNNLITEQENFNLSIWNESGDYELIYKELGNLLTLFKADLISELSITLLFSDNDGD